MREMFKHHSSSIFLVRTFPCQLLHTFIVTSGWNSALFVTSGWKTALFVVKFLFHYSTSHSNAIVVIPFVQAACSTSRRTTRHTASRPKIAKPSHSSSPPRRTDCSTSSSCTCWPAPAPRPPPAPRGAARGHQTVASRRRWCRTLMKGRRSSHPTTIRRRQAWSWKPWLTLAARMRRAHAIRTSRLQPAPFRLLICQARLRKRVYSH